MHATKLLIIVPAFNEGETIAGVLQRLLEIKQEHWDILVVNDHSTDNTSEIAREFACHVIDLPINLGIGGCVQTGFQYALECGYDCVIQFDGDGQHQPEEVQRMVRRLYAEEADMVIGSRFKIRPSTEEHHRSTSIRRLGIRTLRYLCFLLTGKFVTDPTSGFRVYSRQAIELLAEQYPHNYPEPETIIFLSKHHMKIVEIPAFMKERSGGSSSIEHHGISYMLNVMLGMVISSIRPRSTRLTV